MQKFPISSSISLSLMVRICLSFLMNLIILVTLFGNTLVVVSVIKFRRLRSQMCFRFLCSLAISDICVAVFVMFVSMIYFLVQLWPFGWVFCYFWMSCDVMCCTASILHLCAVAIDRYISIAHGLRYATLMTGRRALTIIVAIWLLSVLISFVPIYSNWFGPLNWNGTFHGSCDLDVNHVYALISSLTSFYIPFLALSVIYFEIYRIASFQAKQIRHQQSRSESKKSKNDRKAIKTVGLIVGLFSLCWFPFFIMYVVRGFCKTCFIDNNWILFITWIGYVNSSFNPILYCFTQREFRNIANEDCRQAMMIALQKVCLQSIQNLIQSKDNRQQRPFDNHD
uniref:GCR484 n=1 Tax=Schmidtea mediterranea TaxID=79327 RepID=A0A193KUR0_SCHMD|nr:GCR484 [Schmidtea mediterranea]